MIRSRLHIDFETQSQCELTTAGTYVYSLHPSTRVTHLGFRFDGEPVQQWKADAFFQKPFERWAPTSLLDARIIEHIANGGEVVCHNAAFERRIWNNVFRQQILKTSGQDLPVMTIEQQDCTLARALVLSYPDDLDTLGKVLNIKNLKDASMKSSVLAFAKLDTGGVPRIRVTPELVAKLDAYNVLDVEAESEVDERLSPLSSNERQLWRLDQLINDRGIPVSRHEVLCAQAMAASAKRLINEGVRALTKGHVQSASEVVKIMEWLAGQGIHIKSLAENDLKQLDLTGRPQASRLVELRTSGSKSSVAKFDKMLACMGADERLRDQYAFAKANTLRWAGRLVQFQNLKKLDLARDGSLIEEVFNAFDLYGPEGDASARYVELMTGAPSVEVLAKAMRRFIKAPPGKQFYGGDFSNIEGRFNAWMNGEDWKVQAFRDYDAGLSADLYVLAYSKAFGKPLDQVSTSERQIGKVQELLLGYQGGVGAILKAQKTLGFRVGDLVPVVRAATSAETWQGFLDAYRGAIDKHGLGEEPWAAVKTIIRNFRLQNAKIAAGWYALQEAAIQAVESPGIPVTVKGIRGTTYLVHQDILWCKLPSNRPIAYVHPSLVLERQDRLIWNDGLQESLQDYTKRDIDDFVNLGLARVSEGKLRKQVRVWGKKDGRWLPRRLYGGLQCENNTQAGCRDLQGAAMLRCDASRYAVIGHTHDDILSEVNEGFGSEGEFRAIMAQGMNWTAGLPIAVKAWSGVRYGH